MPLSEFLRMARGKLESDQQNPCPVNFSTQAEDDLVKLVWENGQIVMQGGSSRVNKNPTLHSSPSNNTPIFLNAATISRIAKFCEVDSIFNDLSPVVPSAGDLDLGQDNDMVPWMNYPVALPHYYAESFHEISGVTANGLSTQNSFALKDKKSSCNQNNSDLLNFSHFSRPATKEEKMEIKGSELTFTGNNIVKSSLVDQSTATRPGTNEERTGNLCRENSIMNENPQIRDNPIADANKEPMVASSVGSGNSGDRISCEQVHNSKRKFRDIDESECNGDDVETESAGLRKKSTGHGGNGSKRGRAAEVHNLSERRRRDRINEKMRALQELIPNCNKGDKASMLDEAIEYLKTLQFQVQMMSMGAGLCMPPLMFPSGIHPAHLPHFSPMGFGMGMGLGFGMGMSDMNGSSSYPPILSLPQMQGPQFLSPMPGSANFPRIPNPNLPLYVHHPSQGLHPVYNSPPIAPLTGQPPVTSAIGALQTGNQSEPNRNPQLVHNSSINHSSNQQQTTNDVLDKSAVIQETKQATATNVSKVAGCD